MKKLYGDDMNSEEIEALIRPNIRALTPYRSARDDFKKGLLLDANENSFGSPMRHNLALNRYPSPAQERLRKRIADYRQVETENIFTGVGSDEAIDLLIRIFCEPGEDSVIITPPTYGMYRVAAEINNIAVETVQLSEDFQPNPTAILQNRSERAKLLFLCSPNNPTGNDLDRTRILKLVELFPGIVIVDEAYIDFSSQESMAFLVQQYPNLVILQTFSKSFGLAGIRLGIAISSPLITSYLMKVKAPYNVNKLSAEAALEAFGKLHLIRLNIEQIRQERDKLAKELRQIPTVEKVFPSNANFLLFRIENALEIYRKLAEQEIIVRYRGNEPGCEECLRVTIGMPDENVRFLNALTEITR